MHHKHVPFHRNPHTLANTCPLPNPHSPPQRNINGTRRSFDRDRSQRCSTLLRPTRRRDLAPNKSPPHQSPPISLDGAEIRSKRSTVVYTPPASCKLQSNLRGKFLHPSSRCLVLTLAVSFFIVVICKPTHARELHVPRRDLTSSSHQNNIHKLSITLHRPYQYIAQPKKHRCSQPYQLCKPLSGSFTKLRSQNIVLTPVQNSLQNVQTLAFNQSIMHKQFSAYSLPHPTSVKQSFLTQNFCKPQFDASPVTFVNQNFLTPQKLQVVGFTYLSSAPTLAPTSQVRSVPIFHTFAKPIPTYCTYTQTIAQ